MEQLRQPIVPSSFLPSLRRLNTCSSGALSLVLQSLIQLYQPNLRLNFKFQTPSGDSGYASDDDDEESKVRDTSLNNHDSECGSDTEEVWQIARADPIERDFAMRWMTGFLSRGLEWLAEGEDSGSELESEEREAIYEGISTLLSSCSQASETGALLRDFIFPDPKSGTNIGDGAESKYTVKIVLKDEDLGSSDHNGVGLQTWGASCVMAERIVAFPHLYGLTLASSPSASASRPLRVLELGAGTGLLSLVVGNLLVQMGDVSAEIYATDYHPDVLANLEENVAANPDSSSFPTKSKAPVSLQIAPLDWEVIHNSPNAPLAAPFDEPFDVIIASDVVYRPQHASWLASVVKKLLRRPSDMSEHPPTAHIMAASRTTHLNTHSSLRAAFPSVDEKAVLTRPGDADIRAVDVIDHVRLKGTGRADENGYREYTIRWS